MPGRNTPEREKRERGSWWASPFPSSALHTLRSFLPIGFPGLHGLWAGDQLEAKATESPHKASPEQRGTENHFPQRLHTSRHQRPTRRESELLQPPGAGQSPGAAPLPLPEPRHVRPAPPSPADFLVDTDRQQYTRQSVTTYRLTFHYLQVSSGWDDASKNTKARQ